MTERPIPQVVQAAAAERELGLIQWVDWAARPLKASTYLYDEGLVRTGGVRGAVKASERWKDLQAFRHGLSVEIGYDADLGSVRSHMAHSYEATFRGGGKPIAFHINEEPDRTLASDYFAFGLRDKTRLNERAASAAAHLYRKMEWALAGQAILVGQKILSDTVSFGPVHATYAGIEARGVELPWEDVTVESAMPPLPSKQSLLRKPTQVLRSSVTLQATPEGSSAQFEFNEYDVVNLAVLKDLCRRKQR